MTWRRVREIVYRNNIKKALNVQSKGTKLKLYDEFEDGMFEMKLPKDLDEWYFTDYEVSETPLLYTCDVQKEDPNYRPLTVEEKGRRLDAFKTKRRVTYR